MRYYIPTTILNLSNILSTDSISPDAFYRERNFGSPHWRRINEKCSENIIVLYSRPFFFSLESDGQENHPMFILIESEEDFIQIGDGVYACDHTLYFDWNTYFLFLSEEDLKIANSLVQISDSAKLYSLYRDKRMIVDQSMNNTHIEVNTVAESNLNRGSVESDYRLNKMKGFLYGYYIGAILTCRPQGVGSIKALKQIYAKIASLFSSYSFDEKPSEDLLRCEEDIKKCISEEISNQNKINLFHNHLPDISKREVVVDDMRLISLNNNYVKEEVDKQLFASWINNILSDKKWGRSVNAVKSQLADELTDEAIRIYGNPKWQTSATRTFLNGLRHSLAGEYFQIEWNNGMLSSLAAFLMRGDDWKDMMEFMQSNGMYDYRLAFAFYGTWTGFASIPTDFSDFFFSQEKRYVKSVCDEFYKQLFGKTIPAIVKKEEFVKKEDSLREKIMKIWASMPPELRGKTNKDEKKNKDIIEKVLVEIGVSHNSNSFLQALSKQPGWKRGDRIKFFRKSLSGDLFMD